MLILKRKSQISRLAKVFPFCRISNSIIDDYSYVNLFAKVNNTTIGKYCSISINFKSGLGIHPSNFISTSPIFYSKKNALNKTFSETDNFTEFKPVTIKNDVWIGADVIILDGVTIGNGAIIGAKSVVTKDVPDYAIVGGVPAKIIKYRFSDEMIKELKRLKWWNWDDNKLKKYNKLFSKEVTLNELKSIEN
ncbi:CatB-related O-acetyltransferase [Tamlana sp. 62-3]|uniref:CatB-related O-acetyltransferase n=1 Tax=Neotamlana sargassicola TaxID=2883125 RepID=A0A9X1I5P4_9FLAO|nr:CatB-related O-acetyltransferase [Tamlana sargassicola]MCB4807310.1 CatB-related O-acetyltransferase [Tamlana sargassicola]